MNKQHLFVRLFLGPLFALCLIPALSRAATVNLSANNSLAAAGAWSNVPYCYADDGLYTTGTGLANGQRYFRVGLADPADTVDKRITNVVIYAKGYSDNGRAKVRLIPYFAGAAGTSSASYTFGVTEATQSFDITPQRNPWRWQDVVSLGVQFTPRTATTFYVNHIFAMVIYVDTITTIQKHYFVFDAIASPETLGLYFPVVVNSLTTLGDTVMSSYFGSAGLTDFTGTVTPSIVTFAAGHCSTQVMIGRDTTVTALTVNDGDTTGSSNQFAVINPGLHHFGFAPIGSQTSGSPFPVSIAALDYYGDTATAFTDRVRLWDASGSLAPDSSGPFSSGLWTGSVTIGSAFVSDTVFCSRTVGGRTYAGASNGFTFLLGVAGESTTAGMGRVLSIKAYPNPVRGELGLDVISPVAGMLNVTMYNILGQVEYRRESRPVTAGVTRVNIPLSSNTRPGVYLIEATVGDRLRQVQKVIIMK